MGARFGMIMCQQRLDQKFFFFFTFSAARTFERKSEQLEGIQLIAIAAT
jgi:hypothetical protein